MSILYSYVAKVIAFGFIISVCLCSMNYNPTRSLVSNSIITSYDVERSDYKRSERFYENRSELIESSSQTKSDYKVELAMNETDVGEKVLLAFKEADELYHEKNRGYVRVSSVSETVKQNFAHCSKTRKETISLQDKSESTIKSLAVLGGNPISSPLLMQQKRHNRSMSSTVHCLDLDLGHDVVPGFSTASHQKLVFPQATCVVISHSSLTEQAESIDKIVNGTKWNYEKPADKGSSIVHRVKLFILKSIGALLWVYVMCGLLAVVYAESIAINGARRLSRTHDYMFGWRKVPRGQGYKDRGYAIRVYKGKMPSLTKLLYSPRILYYFSQLPCR